MKKILILLFTITLSLLVLTGCGEKEKVEPNLNENFIPEESQMDNNNENLKLLINEDSSDFIEITFNPDRFAVEEYYYNEPQTDIYVTDITNGSNYLIYIDSAEGYSVKDYYSKLVTNAKNNIKSDNVDITEMETVKYGGIDFKKFTASWQEEYEYNSKETGELIQGVSEKEETAIFAQISKGIFLRYDGPVDDELLNNLFVKIKK